ncbi:MAG: ankyrin repeat domain-containing protein [Acidimicrobiales bacterium]
MGGSGSARERRRLRQLVVGGVAALAVLLLGGVGIVWLYGAVGDLGASMSGDVCRRSDVRLVRAAGDGDLETVRRALERGADPSRADRSSNTPLGCAIPRGRDDVVAALLDAGADPNGDSGSGPFREVPLGLAVRRGDLAATKALSAHGADPQRPDCKGTAIDEAFRQEDRAIVRALLDAGADPNGRPGHRPLVAAATKGDLELVDLLLAHHVSLAADADPPAAAGTTPEARTGDVALVLAAGNGHTTVVGRLLDAGAGPNAITSSSALLRSLLYGHHDVTELLLARGADPNLGRADELTLRFVSAGGAGPSDTRSVSPWIGRRVVEVLDQAAAARPSTTLPFPGPESTTSTAVPDPRLVGCSFAGTTATTTTTMAVGTSLQSGLPTSLQTEHDVAPLAVALLTGSQRDLEALLDHGADPNRLSLDHLTPLYLAGISCNVEAAQVLLAHGADPQAGPVDARLSSPVAAPSPSLPGGAPSSVAVCAEVRALAP